MRECKNFAELEQVLSDYGITMAPKVKQLHFGATYKAVSGIITAVDMFPQLRGYVRRIDVWHNNNWLMSTSYNGTVYLSYNRFNRIFPIKEKQLNSCTNGRWYHPVNMSYDGLGNHEAGHLLVKAYIDKHYPSKSDDFKSHLWSNSGAAKDILNTIAKQNNVKLYNLQKKVCVYACENPSECIAECICDFMTNGYEAAELSQLVVKFFREDGTDED